MFVVGDYMKTYVECIYLDHSNGIIDPLFIIYNGVKYKIDKFKFVGSRAAKTGGAGNCWFVAINGQKRKLFLDHHFNVFFVEK